MARRLPKRGFTNIFKKRYALIQVRDLMTFEKDSVINPGVLVESALVDTLLDGVKLLGLLADGSAAVARAHRIDEDQVGVVQNGVFVVH